jgi:hypothetical protein
MLPQLAKGDANKMWIIPSEFNDALKGLGAMIGGQAGSTAPVADPDGLSEEFAAPEKVDVIAEIAAQKAADEAESQRSVQQAIAEAAAIEGRRAAAVSTTGAPALEGAAPTELAPLPVLEADPEQA